MRSNAHWPPPSKRPIVSSFFVLILAVALTGLGCYLFFRSIRASQFGVPVIGKVVENYTTTKKGKKSWSSKAIFTLPDGKTADLSWGGKWEIGSPLEALAVPENGVYSLVRRDGMNLWGGPSFVSAFGIGFLLLGLYSLKRSRLRYAEINWLIRNGKELPVSITGVHKTVTRSKKNRTRRSWNIAARSEDGKIYNSEKLQRDPGSDLVGTTVTILVHPENPDVFYFPATSL